MSRAQSLEQQDAMISAISEVEQAFVTLKKDPWADHTKISDEVLDPIFALYYEKIKRSNRINKTDFHILVDVMNKEEVCEEMIKVLDKIYDAANI